MGFIARDYQSEVITCVDSYFCTKGSDSGNPLIAMPTGTGKAVVIALLLQYYFARYPRLKVLIPTHVKELVGQNYNKLVELWPGAPAGINSEGLKKRDYQHPIIFCGIQSVYQDAHLFGKVDLFIIDEAHLVSPEAKTRYQRMITDLLRINKHMKVIGLTATPWRMGQGTLTDEGGLFTDLIIDYTRLDVFNRFLDEGYLSPLIPRPLKTYLDTTGVGVTGDDYNQGALQKAVDKEAITRAALEETLEVASDRKVWLIFATGIQHCEHISEMLTEMGVSNVAIHSKLSPTERDRRYKLWRTGKVKAAISMGVLTTGVDYPEIDLIVMLRPTQSVILWIQMLGRGTRPVYADGFDLTTIEGRLLAIAASQKQNCLVLDFARNTLRLGPINDPVLPRKKGDKKGEAPVKECPNCGLYCHASVRYCGGSPKETPKGCGHEFTFEVKITSDASTEALIRFDLPIVEDFEVERITYQKQVGGQGFPMLLVSYYTKAEKGKRVRKFKEYVCLMHPNGGALRRAHDWWRERAGTDKSVPMTVTDAIKRNEELKASTHIRVWINTKMPEIKLHCFDGTYFGKNAPSDSRPFVEVEQYADWDAIMPKDEFKKPEDKINWDDDIPF